jgi:phosphoribosylaminoimidazolecarboxamide formyltransferase/IMP cyclohydrolase
MDLRYGCNPHQSFATAQPLAQAPCELVSGQPSLINLLDALNAWQLVKEVKQALGLPAAASFKHVSPAGAAVAQPLDGPLAEAYEVAGVELTPAALAYVRARGADPKCSYGDFAALSEPVDEATAKFLKGVVSDGIIAPAYEPAALEILEQKKGGKFLVLSADPDFETPARESREMYGMRLTQDRNNRVFVLEDLKDLVCGELPDQAKRDLVLGMTTLKYTQSNSVGFAVDGQMIGIGAGQQSRVDCTKLAGGKADVWQLRRHPKVLGLRFKPEVKRQERVNWRVRYIEGDLVPSEETGLRAAVEGELSPLTAEEKADYLAGVTGVSLVSDGFIPFRDNIDHAQRHGVRYVAQPGGSTRDADVAAACEEYGIAMVHTHIRAFHH